MESPNADEIELEGRVREPDRWRVPFVADDPRSDDGGARVESESDEFECWWDTRGRTGSAVGRDGMVSARPRRTWIGESVLGKASEVSRLLPFNEAVIGVLVVALADATAFSTERLRNSREEVGVTGGSASIDDL